jgi:release factor glutamine methyltransferase
MTIDEILKKATILLKSKNIPSAALDAEVLLCYTIKKSKEFLYTNRDQKLTANQEKKFRALVTRRAKLEPVAYITGQKEFYGLNFIVNKHVLIPRPETELLIDEIVKTIHELPLWPNVNCQLSIVDVGTGSGCIAVTLAKHLPKTKIYATDISAKALKIAKRNAKLHQINPRSYSAGVKINWQQGDLLEPLKNQKIDIIVANLPYLDKKTYQLPSLKFEPKIALDGGEDGLKFYKKLLKQTRDFQFKPMVIFCEINPQQTITFKKLTKQYLPTYRVKTKKDLVGLNRIVKIYPK